MTSLGFWLDSKRKFARVTIQQEIIRRSAYGAHSIHSLKINTCRMTEGTSEIQTDNVKQFTCTSWNRQSRRINGERGSGCQPTSRVAAQWRHTIARLSIKSDRRSLHTRNTKVSKWNSALPDSEIFCKSAGNRRNIWCYSTLFEKYAVTDLIRFDENDTKNFPHFEQQ